MLQQTPDTQRRPPFPPSLLFSFLSFFPPSLENVDVGEEDCLLFLLSPPFPFFPPFFFFPPFPVRGGDDIDDRNNRWCGLIRCFFFFPFPFFLPSFLFPWLGKFGSLGNSDGFPRRQYRCTSLFSSPPLRSPSFPIRREEGASFPLSFCSLFSPFPPLP